MREILEKRFKFSALKKQQLCNFLDCKNQSKNRRQRHPIEDAIKNKKKNFSKLMVINVLLENFVLSCPTNKILSVPTEVR